MRVFISWSGGLSQSIAKEIFEWLPMMVQSIDPYMSSESIEKGARWASNVASELEVSKFGILILLPDNLTSPWLHFEAGALAKVVGESKLAPLLFGLKPSDVHPPLSQFQVTVFEKDEIWKLVKSINSTEVDEGLPEPRLQKMFDALWPGLEEKIKPILHNALRKVEKDPQKIERDSSAVMEEILILARQQAQILSSPERNIPHEIFRDLMSAIDDIRTSNRGGRVDRDLIEIMLKRWDSVFDLIKKMSAISFRKDEEQALISMSERLDGVMREISMLYGGRFVRRRHVREQVPDPVLMRHVSLARGNPAPIQEKPLTEKNRSEEDGS